MQACPNCGRENADDANFCANYAPPPRAAAPRRQERKVVSVLFCDLVGFTSRAERLDPEDVRAVLEPYHAHVRAELERFGGTVEKFIGDAVMAVFGAPVAHEDDPERAVRAGLAIRDWAAEQELELRIGVNTGEALVTIGGEPLAAGDVVNTAARLQAAAPVGGVLVGETTWRATRDRIDYREAEPVQAKGKAEPVPVWEATHARALVTVERDARVPLVGRERELALLLESLRRAREDREPQLVTLVGVPGIGKSRLVFELFRAIETEDELVYWRRGRSLPYGDGVTFWALGEMVKAQAGVLESDSGEQAAEKLRTALAALFAGDADAAWVERHLRPLIGLGADGDERTSEEARTAWRRFFEAMAEERPLVLVFEDLHWADDSLLEFVDELVEWTSGVPLLVVGTARTELLARRPDWGGGKPNALTLSLQPLSDDETASLVAALLGTPVVAAETQAALLAHAGGNPLFAEEFARYVEERGGGELEVPESVHGIIAARLDGLATEDKDLLRDAAVIGRSFWSGALATISTLEPDHVHRRLHALARREFVRPERRSTVAGESEFIFRHALLRDVAYGQIPRSIRAEKHRRAAEWIEALSPDRTEDRAEMLAHHYAAALEYAQAAGQETEELSERARAALVDAGDRAFSLYAFPAAAGFYTRALALWPPGANPPSPHLRLRVARAYHLIGDERREQALEEAREAALETGDRATVAAAEAMLAGLAWERGDGACADLHMGRALELVQGERPSVAKAHVLVNAAGLLMVRDENEDAVRVGREALALAESLGLDDLVAAALNTVGSARTGLGDLGGVADLERAVEIAVSANAPEAVRAYNNLATNLRDCGELARARSTAEEGIRVGERFGPTPMLRWLRNAHTVDLYFAGEWDRAVARADEEIAEAESAPHYQEHGFRLLRAMVRAARSDLAGAVEDIEPALALARDTGDAQALAPTLGGATRVFFSAGDPARARELAEELVEVVRASEGYVSLGSFIAPFAAELGVAAGLREALGSPAADESRWAAATRAQLEGRHLEAAEIYSGMPMRPAEAEARLVAAEQLVREGRRAEADEQLRRSLAFWRSVGATLYIRRGEALLAASA
jgi:class 3 adenylate cyclase/tetratricopeptide (TPR) repeat protein